MPPLRAPALWSTAILCGVTAGCQVYLSGGPGRDDTRPSPTQERHASAPAATPMAAPASTPAAPRDAEAAAVPAPAPPRRWGATTYPGERYYRAGQTRVVLDAVEDALEARDFHLLRFGTSPRGGEVHAERREHLASPPRTTTSAAWSVHAAVIRITGSTWEDCCYVKAAFTTTRLNSRGDVLATTTADEPENHLLRTWFFDDVAARVPAPPTY